MIRHCTVQAAVIAAVLTSSTATAQGRVEIWGAVTGAPIGSGTVRSDYSPPLLLDGDFSSRATQMLSIDSTFAAGWEAGFNVFFSEHLGVQALVDRTSSAVTGANGPYAYTLQYTSRQPPNDQLVPVAVEQSVPWPDSSGSLTQLLLAVNVVTRARVTRRISARASAGPALARTSATIQPLAYTSFHLGGHGVLFADEARIAIAVGPEYTRGYTVGGELDIGLTSHVAVIAGYRYFGRFDSDFVATPGTDAEALGSPRVQLPIGGSRFLVGLRVDR